jgi:hypothetical protein
MTAKAYRLLRAILMTAAAEDRLITRNPCQLRRADKEHSEERRCQCNQMCPRVRACTSCNTTMPHYLSGTVNPLRLSSTDSDTLQQLRRWTLTHVCGLTLMIEHAVLACPSVP